MKKVIVALLLGLGLVTVLNVSMSQEKKTEAEQKPNDHFVNIEAIESMKNK